MTDDNRDGHPGDMNDQDITNTLRASLHPLAVQLVADAPPGRAPFSGVDALVSAAIQIVFESMIGRMALELLKPEKISAMSPLDIVNCITKIMRLVPQEISRPVAIDLIDKLKGTNNVDLSSLAIPDSPSLVLEPLSDHAPQDPQSE